jgi:hypothetical protein
MDKEGKIRKSNRKEPTLEGLLTKALSRSVSYREYRTEMTRQAIAGETSGALQSDSLIAYTLLNDRRMRRWEKTYRLPDSVRLELENVEGELIWLVLSESWCGDAAPLLPVLRAFEEACPGLRLHLADRDDHPELMARFKTDGALSIPKLLVLDPDGTNVLASWGPRPTAPMEMARAYKAEYGKLSPEFREALQRWYNKDKGRAITEELKGLFTLKEVRDSAFL